MKYLIYTLLILSTGLLIFNLTQLDYEQLFGAGNVNVLIGVVASLCVIVLMFIILQARSIRKIQEPKS